MQLLRSKRNLGFPAYGQPKCNVSEQRSFMELTAPDFVTPTQWFEGAHADDPRFHGTKQLMLAVLVDALQCLQTCVSGRTAVHRRRFAEAEAWVADRDAQGPFAFDTVCEALGIDADYLRTGLKEWLQRQLTGTHPYPLVRWVASRRPGAIGSPVRRRRHRAKGSRSRLTNRDVRTRTSGL
jgi:hypothetical protein